MSLFGLKLAYILLFLLLPASMLGQCPAAPAVPQELMDFTSHLDDAYTHHDAAALQGLISGSYIATMPSGVQLGKEQWLNEVSASSPNAFDTYAVHKPCLRQLSPASAVRAFQLIEKGKNAGGPFANYFFVTEVYSSAAANEKKALPGSPLAWKVVGTHLARFKPGPSGPGAMLGWKPVTVKPSNARPKQHNSGPVHVQKIIQANEDAIAMAWIKHDAATLERLIADDERAVLSNGRTGDKRSAVRHAMQSEKGSTEMTDRSIHVFGDMAIFTAQIEDKTLDSQTNKAVVRTRVTDIWIKRAAGWQLLALHESLLD